MASKCRECGAESNSPYICTKCGKPLTSRDATKSPPSVQPTNAANAAAAVPAPSAVEVGIAMERAARRDRRMHLLSRFGATLLLLGVLAGIGYAGVRLHKAGLRGPTRWTADPTLPDVMSSVLHDQRGDRHAVEVFCQESSSWADRTSEALLKAPAAERASLATQVVGHWEAIDDGYRVLANRATASDAAELLKKCTGSWKQIGAVLTELEMGTPGSDPAQLAQLSKSLTSATASTSQRATTVTAQTAPATTPVTSPAISKPPPRAHVKHPVHHELEIVVHPSRSTNP